MNVRVLILSACTALLVFGAGWVSAQAPENNIDQPPVWAQESPDDKPAEMFQGRRRGRGEDMAPEERERRRRYLEQFRMIKLLELLNLEEDQEVEFMTMFREMRRNLRANEVDRRAALEKLSMLAKGESVSDAEVDQEIDKLVTTERDMLKIREQFIYKAREILSTKQLAMLVLFHERFDAELLQAAGVGGRGPHRMIDEFNNNEF